MRSLTLLHDEIRGCRNCSLWKSARNAVPGEGPADARIMLVGQNPGAGEDKTGKPFVGRSGRFLERILAAHGMNREDFFITSIVKHVTHGNRPPRQSEIDACMPYLVRQFDIIRPAIVVFMGNIARKAPRPADMTCIYTCHPAAAMRFPAMRHRFERDLQRLRSLIDQPEGAR